MYIEKQEKYIMCLTVLLTFKIKQKGAVTNRYSILSFYFFRTHLI